MANNVISLQKIKKVYNENTEFAVEALKDIDLDIKEGSFNAVIGQSGSGKSTLLNVLGTLDHATSGTLFIDGIKIHQKMKNKELSQIRNRQLGFIFQFHYLLPEFSVLENVLIPYQMSHKKTDNNAKERALMLIDLVGLSDVKDKLSSKISGGQQQRVAIARCLMNQPKIILADEPTGNLDSDNAAQIYKLFREINQKFGTTFIVITHDERIAAKADHIIVIKDGLITQDKIL